MWRVEHETHALEDASEAVRNFLAGRDFDAAVGVGHDLFDALRRYQQSVVIANLGGEILETLPENHGGYASVADEEAQAHLALGATDRALARYQQLLLRQENLVEAEPERADYQRDLSVYYERMGDLFGALGQGNEAPTGLSEVARDLRAAGAGRARARRLPARPLGVPQQGRRPVPRPRSGGGGPPIPKSGQF
jgi:hypothetical protein